MKMQFIQFNRAPQPQDGTSGAWQTNVPDAGAGNAQRSGANEQADASRGGASTAAVKPGPRPTGFETATSTGQGEKSYEEAIAKGEERLQPKKPADKK